MNSLSIFITSFLNSGYCRLKKFVASPPPHWIYLVFLIENGSSAFSFYMYISKSIHLGKTFIHCGQKGALICGSIAVQLLCDQSFWCLSWFWYGCLPHLSSGCAGHYHRACAGCGASSLLCGCGRPVRDGVCSLVAEVEALTVRLHQALLPLNTCSAPKERARGRIL